MTSHVLNVSARGVIRTLRHQFTRSTTFLSEALQNARRAGATSVWVEWDPRTSVMAIRDDGHGIRDFNALLTVGVSGWNRKVLDEENPFGVGFMAAVLASQHINIRSLDQRLDFDTRDLLNFEPIEVTTIDGEIHYGTQLKLTLHTSTLPPTAAHMTTPDTAAAWRTLLEEMVAGFPIPVYFNADPLPRPHAVQGGLTFFDTEVGHLYLNNWHACQPSDRGDMPRLYCQGLPLHIEDARRNRPADILHLAPNFRVRMPDRDMLIDADTDKDLISETRLTLWRKRLIECHGSLSPQEFVDRYWRLCVRLNLPDLLRDHPLGASMLSRYTNPVVLTSDPDFLGAWTHSALPTRDALFIEDIPADVDTAAALASVYAIARRLPVLDADVPACHWSRTRALDLLDEDLNINYKVNGEINSGVLKGAWVCCKVVVCESVTVYFEPTESCEIPARIRALLQPVTIAKWAFYDPHQACIIVPSEVDWCGYAVRQVSDYIDRDDDHFDQDDCDTDQAALHHLVECLRCKSPHAYLGALLRSIRLDPALLGDTTFQVRYDPIQSRLTVLAP